MNYNSHDDAKKWYFWMEYRRDKKGHLVLSMK
jgi:hypothetical protein